MADYDKVLKNYCMRKVTESTAQNTTLEFHPEFESSKRSHISAYFIHIFIANFLQLRNLH